MKNSILLALLFIPAASGFAQPAPYTNVPRSFVFRQEDFRIVDGQLYNIRLATNWVSTVRPFPVVPYDAVPVWNSWEKVKLTQVGKLSIMADVYVDSPDVGDEYWKAILIYHYPDKDLAVTGDKLKPYPMMRVANWTDTNSGVVLAAFDCGMLDTPENRKTLKKSQPQP